MLSTFRLILISLINFLKSKNILGERISNLLCTVLSEEVLNFLAFGILNNIILTILYQIFLFIMNYKASAVLLYLCGFLISFYTNNFRVFNNSEIKFKKAKKFILLYITNCVFNYCSLLFLVDYLNFSPRIAVIIIIFIASPLNFILARKIFKSPVKEDNF